MSKTTRKNRTERKLILSFSRAISSSPLSSSLNQYFILFSFPFWSLLFFMKLLSWILSKNDSMFNKENGKIGQPILPSLFISLVPFPLPFAFSGSATESIFTLFIFNVIMERKAEQGGERERKETSKSKRREIPFRRVIFSLSFRGSVSIHSFALYSDVTWFTPKVLSLSFHLDHLLNSPSKSWALHLFAPLTLSSPHLHTNYGFIFFHSSLHLSPHRRNKTERGMGMRQEMMIQKIGEQMLKSPKKTICWVLLGSRDE